MRFFTRRTLVGAGIVIAIGGASATAVVFTRDDGTTTSVSASPRDETTTTTTSTTTTSTTTTTTQPPAPEPEPAPAPAPQAAPRPAPAPAPAPEPAPPPPPPPPPPSFCSGGAGGVAGAVLAAMNADRGGGLCWNSQLGGIAQNWANWMAANKSLTHQNLGGLIGQTPFMTMGENLLVGPAGMSAGEMEAAWMNSPPHRANILNGAFSAVGVGVAVDNQGQVWVAVDFGG